MAEILADDISSDDRRRVVNAGMRHGRDAEIADMRALADVGITYITSTVIATRGERLALNRVRFSDRDAATRGFQLEVLGIAEIDADERIAARRVRPRRHRRCLRGTRCPVPGRRSGRPRAHVVGDRADLRRIQPARIPLDDAGSGVTSIIGRAYRSSPVDVPHPSCHVGPHSGRQDLHRGCASAERTRSGRHRTR